MRLGTIYFLPLPWGRIKVGVSLCWFRPFPPSYLPPRRGEELIHEFSYQRHTLVCFTRRRPDRPSGFFPPENHRGSKRPDEPRHAGGSGLREKNSLNYSQTLPRPRHRRGGVAGQRRQRTLPL